MNGGGHHGAPRCHQPHPYSSRPLVRPQPPVGALGGDRARYYAREPAWRLLHMRSPCSSCTRPALGPTWRTTTRKARASPARLSPGTFSGPSARGVRTGSATSMPNPCTPHVLSPSLARDRAHGTLFTSTGSPPASPPWPRAGALACTCSPQPRAGLPGGARLHSPSCERSPHTCVPKASAPPLQPGPWRPTTLGRAVHRQSACARAEP